jgi:hypothetical protein
MRRHLLGHLKEPLTVRQPHPSSIPDEGSSFPLLLPHDSNVNVRNMSSILSIDFPSSALLGSIKVF